MTSEPPTVLIIDDHPVARRGIHALVKASFVAAEVYETDHAAEAFAIARDARPDLILLDARMPDSIPAREYCHQLRAILPRASISLITAFADLSVIRECLAAGADGCLLKESSEDDLDGALHRLLAGEVVIAPRVADLLARDLIGPRSATSETHLTGRERDVLSLLAAGCSNRRIAEQLCLSETTVKGYVTNVLQKLNVSSRLEAVVRAYQTGLVEPSGQVPAG